MPISTLHDCNTSTPSLRRRGTPSLIEHPHGHNSGRGMLLADSRTGRVGKHLTNKSIIIAWDAFLLLVESNSTNAGPEQDHIRGSTGTVLFAACAWLRKSEIVAAGAQWKSSKGMDIRIVASRISRSN